MLLPLADEGEFLLIWCDPGSTEAELGDWVVPLWGPGDEPDDQDVCGGWILSFYPADGEENDRQVDATVEFCSSVPPDAPGNFSKVVEISAAGPAYLEGAGAGASVTADAEVAYRLRLLLDDSEQPVRLLVQSWPAELSPARLLRGASEEAVPDLPQLRLPEASLGLAASARIGNDIDQGPNARTLSGGLGTATAKVEVPGGRKKHDWLLFEEVHVWTPGRDGFMYQTDSERWDHHDPDRHRWSATYMRSQDHPDRIAGWLGMIWFIKHPDDDFPERSVHWWRWARRSEPQPLGTPYKSPVLEESLTGHDSVRVVTCTEMPGSPKRTEIVIEHKDVPVEWVDDLTDWWTYQLAIQTLDGGQ